MPVGKVFNAAENQVLVSPVTSYYQGKAIRAQLAESELDLKLKEKKLAQADDTLDVEKRRIAAQEEANKRLREDFEYRVGKDKAQVYAAEGYAAIWSAEKKMESEGEEAGLATAFENIAKYTSTLPEEDQARMQPFLEDGKITRDEFNAVKAGFVGHLGEYGLLESDGETLKDHKNYMMPDGTLVMARPNSEKANMIEDAGGILAGSISPNENKSDPDVKPLNTPTKSEEQIVEELSDTFFSELEKDENTDYGFAGSDSAAKQKIKRWIGEEAEAIQRFEAKRGRPIGFNTAAELAVSDAKKFIVPPKDPGFFSNDSISWEPSPYKRGDRINGSDGKTYIVTGYDENGGPVGEPVGG